MVDFFSDTLVLLFLILINSFFVISEIAVIASRKSKLSSLSQEQSGARSALRLLSKPEDFLSAIQVGITLTNVVIGIYSGAALAEGLAELVGVIPYAAQYQNEISYVLVIVVITYLTVLGEIIPKRIAMLYPEQIAIKTAYAISFFTKISYPFVKSLTFLTKLFLAVLKIKEPANKFSIEELRIMINQSEFSGMLAATEHDMLRRIIHLSNTQVGAIMTPRNKMICLDTQESHEEIMRKIKKYEYHYFPVVSGASSNVLGIVQAKAILLDCHDMGEIAILARNFKTIYIPETARVSKLIDFFRERKMRIALVIDEYGDIEGLVTLNDILKILVGDLAIGAKDQSPNIIRHSENSYTVNGNILIEEIMTILGASSLPGDDSEDYRTLAGFILSQMKSFPKIGDTLHSMGWSFTVLKMEKRRIARILIKKS